MGNAIKAYACMHAVVLPGSVLRRAAVKALSGRHYAAVTALFMTVIMQGIWL